MNNIFEEISLMRRGMKLIGCTKEEIEKATKDVTSAIDYEDALKKIKKYWQ
jgi:hypothetical protein